MLRIQVAAHPGARRERVNLQGEGSLGVWVRARPVDGRANAAIATALGLLPGQVEIVAGARSRRKIVEVELPSVEALRERIAAPGAQTD